MTKSEHTLFLVPWHIGNRLDITVNAARVARELRVFLAEEPELTRRQFEGGLEGVQGLVEATHFDQQIPDPKVVERLVGRGGDRTLRRVEGAVPLAETAEHLGEFVMQERVARFEGDRALQLLNRVPLPRIALVQL